MYFSHSGFMTEREYLQTQHFNCLLDDGTSNMSVPIVLPISTADKVKVEGKDFALTYEGKVVAVMRNPEIYEHRKEERCARQFGLTNAGHPYIKVIFFSSRGKQHIY